LSRSCACSERAEEFHLFKWAADPSASPPPAPGTLYWADDAASIAIGILLVAVRRRGPRFVSE
jgi:hypothetical protein